MQRTLSCPFFRKAFGWCVPIGGLGGLIGLGGGEFRLPILMHSLGFDARSAIPLNLTVSLITLAVAMIARGFFVPLAAIVPHLPEVIGLAAGGMVSGFWGAGLVKRLSARRLVQVIALLLAAIGALLLVETLTTWHPVALLPAGPPTRVAAGLLIGVGVGLVSSMLGVAGGELLIPSLIFVFGVEIRIAGSASILISLGVVLVGLWRYWRLDAFPRGRGVQRITLAMSMGSVIGATAGGLAIAYAPTELLKLLLGAVLIAAAGKTLTSQP
jgi:uncharacterized membrane protein YfcA